MLLSKEVETIWSNRMAGYYIEKGYPKLKPFDKFMVKVEDLKLSSDVNVLFLCDYCLENGNIKVINRIWNDYNRRKHLNIVEKDCCEECKPIKNLELNLLRYGVENQFQRKEIKDKSKVTCQEKYGVDQYSQTKEFSENLEIQRLDKYGVKHYSQSDEYKEKYTGKNHWHWMGGLTPENKKIRNSKEYKEWRKAVFERDNYTCQVCSKRGGSLQAHHIEGFSDNEKLRFEIDNGITMCKEHHFQDYIGSFHYIYGNFHNDRKQLNEYIKNYKLKQDINNNIIRVSTS